MTSLKTGGNYTFQTLLGPALAPFPAAPPQNFSAAGVGSSQEYYGVTFGGGAEYAFWNNWSLGVEYRFADFGKRNVTLVTAPAAGVLLPATPVTMPISLFSQQVTARLNYRFGGGEMATRSVALPGSPGSNWSGCYAGGYAGVAWGRGPVDTFDPSTNGQQVFGPPPLLQTTFYNSSAGESANPAPYSYNLGASGMGGGTLGCNWQPASSRIVWGIEAEAGVMRLSATVNNPYNLAFGFNDTFDTTTVGNWYAAFAGRLGYAVNDVLFYLKGGVGFTQASAEFDRSLHHHRRELQQPGADRARQRQPGVLCGRRRRRVGVRAELDGEGRISLPRPRHQLLGMRPRRRPAVPAEPELLLEARTQRHPHRQDRRELQVLLRPSHGGRYRSPTAGRRTHLKEARLSERAARDARRLRD